MKCLFIFLFSTVGLLHAQKVIDSHPDIYPPEKVGFNELKKINEKWCYYYKDTVEYYFLFTGMEEEKNRNGEVVRRNSYEKGILKYSHEWHNTKERFSLKMKSSISYEEFPNSYSFTYYNENEYPIKSGQYKNGLMVGCWLESGEKKNKGILSEQGVYGYDSNKREGVWQKIIRTKSDSVGYEVIYDVYQNGSIIDYYPEKSTPTGVYRTDGTTDTISGLYFHSDSLFESVGLVYHKYYSDSIIAVGYSYGKWKFNKEKGSIDVDNTDWGKIYIQDLPIYMMLVKKGMEPKTTNIAEERFVIRSERLYSNSCSCGGCGNRFIKRIRTFEP